MLLNEIIKNAPQIDIKQLSCDSRIPMKDCIFFCLKGIKYDGHDYISEAINNGAKVIVYSENIDTSLKAIFIKVPDVLKYLIKISDIFYNHPQSKLFTYLVSGTYGRPAVSSIISDVISKKKNVGSIGVYGIKYGEHYLSSSKPTLTVLDTQKYLAKFVDEGMEYVTLEANNLSYDYRKLNLIRPNIFIYTNTSKDKLSRNSDYISTIQRYLYTLDDTSLIILNKDDISYEELAKATGRNVVTYGKNTTSDYVISEIYTSLKSSIFTLTHDNINYYFDMPLVGLANVYNAVASIVALSESGYNLNDLINEFKVLKQREGIYERIDDENLNILVDAAFYKESYEEILSFAKNNTLKKVISLISLNTSDDKNRIQALISICEKYADHIVLTEDSNFDNKIDQTLTKAAQYIKTKPYLQIEDRITAIETAIDLMNYGDTLLILGKGNEKILNKGYIKENYIGDAKVVKNYIERIKEDIASQDLEDLSY